MMQATFRPIDAWPGERTPSWQRKSKYTFRGSTYSDTLVLLERELDKLNATDLVIQIELSESEIRLDGMPRSNATPRGPGVIVSFDSKHGPLQYATDVFDHWHANLRAIALGLEALRKVDRYGISKRAEQYTGWKQLGGGMPMPAAEKPMDVHEAARYIAEAANADGHFDFDAGLVRAQHRARQHAYREAARRLHPDAGGTTAGFQRLQEAKRVLDKAAQGCA